MKTNEKIQELIIDWMINPRWKGVKRPYTAEEVINLQVLYKVESTLLKVNSKGFVAGLKSDIDDLLIKELENKSENNIDTFKMMKSLISTSVLGFSVKDEKNSKKDVIHKLVNARIVADVIGVHTLIISKINVNNNMEIIAENKALNGFSKENNNLQQAIEKAISYAPYADMICLEATNLDMEQARRFAETIHAKYPNKRLIYGGLSFVKYSMVENAIKQDLFKMGYSFMFNNSELRKDRLVELKFQDFDERIYFDAV
jgi:isocitrate lyase